MLLLFRRPHRRMSSHDHPDGRSYGDLGWVGRRSHLVQLQHLLHPGPRRRSHGSSWNPRLRLEGRDRRGIRLVSFKIASRVADLCLSSLGTLLNCSCVIRPRITLHQNTKWQITVSLRFWFHPDKISHLKFFARIKLCRVSWVLI